MKTSIKTLILFLGLLMAMSAANAQDIGNNDVLRSFRNAVDQITWRNFTMPQEALDSPCYRRYIGQLNVIDNTKVGRSDLNNLLRDYKTLLDALLEWGAMDDPGVQNMIITRSNEGMAALTFFEFAGRSNANTFSEVVKRASGRTFNFGPEAQQKLVEIFDLYNAMMSNTITIDVSKPLSPCERDIKVRFIPHSSEAGFFNWDVVMDIKLDCVCPNPSSNTFVKSGEARIKAVLSMGLDVNDINTARFSPGRDADSPKLEILSIVCCDKGPQDELPDNDGGGQSDQNDGQNDDGGNNNDNNDDNNDDTGLNYDNFEDIQKACCDYEPSRHNIGFWPTIDLGNNFDDSTFGIGVEYNYNMGSSFGNNNWYLGAGAQYATSSGSDGDIKENVFIGSVFAENRTPVVPCVQFTQRIGFDYANGTLDAFGSEADFTQNSVSFGAGININVSDRIDVFGDGQIFRIGSQTITNANDMESDVDIGEARVGPRRFRIGVRLRW